MEKISPSALIDPVFWFFIILVTIIVLVENVIGNPNNPFYQNLIKPALQPPAWVFSVVWIILYFILAYVGYRAYRNLTGRIQTRFFLIYFLGLILHLAWSSLVFGQNQYINGIYIILGLIINSSLLIYISYRSDPVIAWLLVPYLIWLIFAFYLMVETVRLNNLK